MGGVTFSSSNRALLTINPPSKITSLDPASVKPGETASVSITTQYSNFAQGATMASFGPGISVGGDLEGNFGQVTVNSPTSATAVLTVNTAAPMGFRSIIVKTGVQQASLENTFSVRESLPPVNAPPVFLPVNNPSLDAGTTFSVVISATDPENKPLVLTASNLPSFARFADNGNGSGNLSLSPDFNQAGTYPNITLTATDSRGASSTIEVTVTVKKVNRPPVITTTDIPGTGRIEQTYQATIAAQDADNDVLTFSLPQAPSGMAIDGSTGLITWKPLASQTGDHTITVEVDDGFGGKATRQCVITVFDAVGGPAFILGEVYDDTLGLPIENAEVRVLKIKNTTPNPIPTLSTNAMGRFSFSYEGTAGDALLEVRKDGYTRGIRNASLFPNKSFQLFDVRLTPRKDQMVPASTGGSLSSGDAQLLIPPLSLSQDTEVSLTPLSQQGIGFRLPPGWSPMYGVDISPWDVLLKIPATLTIKNIWSITDTGKLTVARFGDDTMGWVAGKASLSGDNIVIEIQSPGQYLLLVRDAFPSPPPIPQALGEPLLPSVTVLPDGGTATVEVIPPSVLSQKGAQGMTGVVVTTQNPVTSGATIEAKVIERYNLINGEVVTTEPFFQDITLYAWPDDGNNNTLSARFPATPSKIYPFGNISYGEVNIDVYLPTSAEGPVENVIGESGGTLIGYDGTGIVIPLSSLTAATVFRLYPLSEAELPVSKPDNLSFLDAMIIQMEGGAFKPNAFPQFIIPGLSAPEGTKVVVTRIENMSGKNELAAVATAKVSGGKLTIEKCLSVSGTQCIYSGSYAFYIPNRPFGFISGNVLKGAVPASGVIISVNNLPFKALTDSAGNFLILSLSGAYTVKALESGTGQTASASGTINDGETQTITLSLTPAVTVTAVTPRDKATGIDLKAQIQVTFSTPVDPATVNSTSFIVIETPQLIPPDPAPDWVTPEHQILIAQFVNFRGFDELTLACPAVLKDGRIESTSPPFNGVSSGQYVVTTWHDPQNGVGYALVAGCSFEPAFIPGPFSFIFPMGFSCYAHLTEFTITIPVNKPFSVDLKKLDGTPVKTASIQGPPKKGEFIDGIIRIVNDSTPPAVFTSSIPDGAKGVLLSENIVIEMSEPIDPDTVNSNTVKVKDSTGNVVEGDVYLAADGKTIVFGPKYGYQYGTTYTIEINGVKDWGGNEITGGYSSTFTTFNPHVLAKIDIPGARAIDRYESASGEKRLVVTGSYGAYDAGITILNVSDPEHPEVKGSTRTFVGIGWDVKALPDFDTPDGTKDVAVVVGGKAATLGYLNLMDIKKPESPSHYEHLILSSSPLYGGPLPDVPYVAGTPYGVAVLGKQYAYVANFGVGIQAVDLTKVTPPQSKAQSKAILSTFPDPSFRGISTMKNHILATRNGLLSILKPDFTEVKDVPVLSIPWHVTGVEAFPTSAEETCDLAVVKTLEGIEIINMKNPTSPRKIAIIPVGGLHGHIAVDRVSRLAYALTAGGLSVISLRDLDPSADLSAITRTIDALRDANGDGIDDRILDSIPEASGTDIILSDQGDLAYIIDGAAGVLKVVWIGKHYGLFINSTSMKSYHELQVDIKWAFGNSNTNVTLKMSLKGGNNQNIEFQKSLGPNVNYFDNYSFIVDLEDKGVPRFTRNQRFEITAESAVDGKEFIDKKDMVILLPVVLIPGINPFYLLDQNAMGGDHTYGKLEEFLKEQTKKKGILGESYALRDESSYPTLYTLTYNRNTDSFIQTPSHKVLLV